MRESLGRGVLARRRWGFAENILAGAGKMAAVQGSRDSLPAKFFQQRPAKIPRLGAVAVDLASRREGAGVAGEELVGDKRRRLGLVFSWFVSRRGRLGGIKSRNIQVDLRKKP